MHHQAARAIMKRMVVGIVTNRRMLLGLGFRLHEDTTQQPHPHHHHHHHHHSIVVDMLFRLRLLTVVVILTVVETVLVVVLLVILVLMLVGRPGRRLFACLGHGSRCPRRRASLSSSASTSA